MFWPATTKTDSAATAAPAPSFNFGNAAGDAKVAAKPFGTPAPAAAAATTQAGFGSFNYSSISTTKAPASTFSLGAQMTTSATGFPVVPGTAATSTAVPNFGLTPSASTPSFGFGHTTTTPTVGSTLGGATTTTSAAAPLFSFSTTTPTAVTTSLPSTTSSFSVSTLGATPGFGLPTTSGGIAFNLGAAPAASIPVGSITSTAATATSAAPSLGSTAAKTTSTSLPFATSTAATTTAATLSLPSTTPATTSQAVVSTASALPAAGALTFSQLEDAINKWTIDLEEQGKLFSNQAKQLNAWDRLLITNGKKVLSLNTGIEHVKQEQQQLDQELDFVLAQQKELEDLITPLEKELKDMPVTDMDRSYTYSLAENIDTQLKQMSEDLKDMIEQLNESNKSQEMSNPITQIGKILNAHMNSLQWIDRNTTKISTHLDQIMKLNDLNRRNQDMAFQRNYD